MKKLSREDLFSLERYAESRLAFREKVLEHKKNRRLDLGTNAALYFEDRLTMQYQVQEMLRIEKIFEADGINEELEAYNPLIPDGSNWKATFMVEFPEVEDFDRVFAIADEDLERADEHKTSAVHFLRFELPPEHAAALKSGARLIAGIDHDSYHVEVRPVPDNIRESLVNDLD
jgi:hypothetical protein